MPLLILPLVCEAAEQAAPVTVTRSVTAPIVHQVRLAGTVTSPRVSELSTQVAGMVQKLEVEEGDRVAPDQLLLALDRELSEHSLARAEAEVARMKTALADARRRLREGRRLAREAHVPESELESLITEVTASEAELAAAHAEARHQAAVVSRHVLRAPFAGVVSRRTTELGEWVTPGTSVLELVAVEGLRFDFRVAQELFPLLDTTTGVTVSLDALPEQRISGKITTIVPVSTSGSRTFLLRVEPVEANHPAITPGMSVSAMLTIDTGREGVVVPRDALLRYPDGRVSVWSVERDSGTQRVREHQIRLGLEFNDRVEVREGVEAGVPLVVEGNETLRDGQAVRVVDGGQ